MTDPTLRFSDRVDSYRRFRPGYPPEIIPFLEREVGLSRSSVVADMGSGTGIFTEMLLRAANQVFAVEPNDAMRQAAEHSLRAMPGFTSVNGTAEEPQLSDASVDIITSAQAFHWFNAPKARQSFARILKPGGRVVLVWNDRKQEGTPFLAGYEQLLREHGIGYPVVDDANLATTIDGFFSRGSCRKEEFANSQTLDLDGMLGRLMSASYVPNTGDAAARFRKAAELLFRNHEVNGMVTLEYLTNVYYGKL
jgi:SAM-dependent methyltransferase